MTRKSKIEVMDLTELQEKFVEAFLGEAYFNPIKAYYAAGYADTYKPYSQAMSVLNSKAVLNAIHKRMADMSTKFWLSEDVVLQRLWKEATDESRGSNQAARINALVWIGKHLGMWKEKAEEKDSQPIIKIVQYGINKEEFEKAINTKEVEEAEKEIELPEGVSVLNYSEDKVH